MSINNTVNYKPSGLIPTLSVNSASEATSFYEKAFGAERVDVTMDTNNKIIESYLKFGDTVVFIHNHFDPTAAPQSSSFYFYVPDADISFKRAIDNGCKITMPIDDQFWGDRVGTVIDPYGFTWSTATKGKDVSKEELIKAHEEYAANQQNKEAKTDT